jgi:hypothetical protein
MRARCSLVALALLASAVGCKPRPRAAKEDRPAAAPATAAQHANAPAATEIHFQIDVPPEELEDFPEGFSPYVSLEAPEPEIAKMRARDEIVLAKRRAVVVIDYPVAKDVEFPIEAATDAGFSRAELVRAISGVYHRMYEEEERTAKQKTIPMDQRTGLINRNETDGVYGIWGHDLGDLVLHTIEVSEKGGVTYLVLGIDS